MHLANPVRVRVVRNDVLAISQGIPEADGLVARARHDLAVVRRERHLAETLERPETCITREGSMLSVSVGVGFASIAKYTIEFALSSMVKCEIETNSDRKLASHTEFTSLVCPTNARTDWPTFLRPTTFRNLR